METSLHAHHVESPLKPALRAADEFPAEASVWPDGLSRRKFIQLMGASLALAGLGACNRQPRKEIVPYVTPPEADLDPEELFYASAFDFEGFARGILVEAHEGRPTKIEGNPRHPDSLGATDIFMQAHVLSLYDPDRSRTPRRRGNPTSWREFDDFWSQQRRAFLSNRGQGLALLTEPTTSPTVLRTLHAVLDTFPQARWYQHTPLGRYDRDGRQIDYDFAAAEVVLAIEGDIFFQHPSALRYCRAFAARRRVDRGKISANRLYVIESSFSLVGSMADARLPAHPQRVPILLNAIADGLRANGSTPNAALSAAEKQFVQNLVRDLHAKAPNVLCVTGPSASDEVRSWADALHHTLGAWGKTAHTLPAVRSDGDPRARGRLIELVRDAEAGQIDTLIMVGVNPIYTGPADLNVVEKFSRIRHTVHLGQHVNETAELSEWHLPQSHALEIWSDLRGFDGTTSIAQPLIQPMYGTRSDAEFFSQLIQAGPVDSYDIVRATWRNGSDDAAFDARWQQWLDRGLMSGSATARQAAPTGPTDFPRLPEPNGQDEPYIQFPPDYGVGDGRWANNAWLQELPRPFTHLVWDNAALISAAFARKLDLRDGDVVRLKTSAGTLDAAVWTVPGHADNFVSLTLGYGRTAAGDVGNLHGFNAYLVRPSEELWSTRLVAIEKRNSRYDFVSTHGHFSLERRDLVHTVELAALGQTHREVESTMSLYPKHEYKQYAWGMSIDLSTCIGCNACVIACQAENNIPSVGKDQVSRGREMHWIRIDRYYEGPDESPRALQQPVPCMQCEHAPCELVCPVGATVHSSEGLNDMVYNRCVGTRYCSNNCPYKVRRFNFLDFREPLESTVYLQKNPNVTVRERGVMEKCTYCVQRINAGRIRAERENRRVRDGEILTACQQACPVEAIVFGDLNDPNSRVVQRKSESTDYPLLPELNTRPRTTYLARVLNPPEGVS